MLATMGFVQKNRDYLCIMNTVETLIQLNNERDCNLNPISTAAHTWLKTARTYSNLHRLQCPQDGLAAHLVLDLARDSV